MEWLNESEILLEILFNVHTEFNSFDNDTIRKSFNALCVVMNGKMIREMDEIIYPVCPLCRDHEKAGFQEGVQEGIILAQKISIA